MKICVFHTGNVIVNRAVPYRNMLFFKKYGLFQSKKNQLVLPVSSYYIEYDNHKLLFDTGWDLKLAKEKNKRLFGMVDHMSHASLKKMKR